MNEDEWLTAIDALLMLPHVRPRKNARRKRLLFACACCRLVWDVLPGEAWRAAVEVTERFADRQATEKERAAAMSAAVIALGIPISAQAASRTCRTDGSAEDTRFIAHYTGVADEGCKPLVADLVREVFGNPFRPVALNPAWLTDTVVALAKGIYEDRGFERMPILADALQDAGCDSDDALNHCRAKRAAHVRGCWVLDLLHPR